MVPVLRCLGICAHCPQEVLVEAAYLEPAATHTRAIVVLRDIVVI
jgi:hypothetical protein